MSQEIVKMSISSFIHGMHIPVLLYKCCDAKERPHDSPIQAAFLNGKQEFYPELSAFGRCFSIFIEIHQRDSGIQKMKQFGSELKSKVFHLERLADAVLLF